MPIYEFKCKKCGHIFEEFVFSSKSNFNDLTCPTCGEKKSEKLMSAFSSTGNSSTGYAPASSCGSGGFS